MTTSTATATKATKATKAPKMSAPKKATKSTTANTTPAPMAKALTMAAVGLNSADANMREIYQQVIKQGATPQKVKQALMFMWHDSHWATSASERNRSTLRSIMGYYSLATPKQQNKVLELVSDHHLRIVPALMAGLGIASEAKTTKLKAQVIGTRTNGKTGNDVPFNVFDNAGKTPVAKVVRSKQLESGKTVASIELKITPPPVKPTTVSINIDHLEELGDLILSKKPNLAKIITAFKLIDGSRPSTILKAKAETEKQKELDKIEKEAEKLAKKEAKESEKLAKQRAKEKKAKKADALKKAKANGKGK